MAKYVKKIDGITVVGNVVSGGITALTGDVTASGTGSVVATLATVNSNIGTFNNVTVNAKGLVTSASNVAYLTSLTGAWLTDGSNTGVGLLLGNSDDNDFSIRRNSVNKITFGTASLTLADATILGTQTTQNLWNTVATTVNAFGLATSIIMGAQAGTLTVRCQTVRGNGLAADLWNVTATTINSFGAAVTLNVGGTATVAITHNYSANATATATTKTVNFATGGLSGSITNVNIGSSVAGALGLITFNQDAVLAKTIRIGNYTTVNKLLITPTNGMMVYDTDLRVISTYNTTTAIWANYLTGASGWTTAGSNTDAGLKIGTSTNNTWDAVSNALTVARFESVSTGDYSLILRNGDTVATTGGATIATTEGQLNLRPASVSGNGAGVAVWASRANSDSAIYFRSSTGVARAFIRDNYSGALETAGDFALGSGSQKITFSNFGFVRIATGAEGLILPTLLGNTTGLSHRFEWSNGSANSNTTGTRSLFSLSTAGSGSITSASGSAIWNFLNFGFSVNQTGTSSGQINAFNFNVGAGVGNVDLVNVISPLSVIRCNLTANALYTFINHTGSAVSNFGGNINLTGTAKITTYAGNTTIGNGVLSVLGTFSVIGRTTAYTAESIMTIPTTGVYEVVVATNCATPANFTNLTLNYTSGGVGQTHDKFNAFTIGIRATETYLISCDASTALTFTTALVGSPTHDILIYVKRIA